MELLVLAIVVIVAFGLYRFTPSNGLSAAPLRAYPDVIRLNSAEYVRAYG
jgi:hypothetical protein